MPRKPKRLALPGTATVVHLSLEQTRALSWKLLNPETTLREAARFAGADERSLRRWLRVPRFGALWDDAQAAHEAILSASVARGERDAYATLQQVMDDPDAPHGTRVDAAKAVLVDVARRKTADQGQRRAQLVPLIEGWSRTVDAPGG